MRGEKNLKEKEKEFLFIDEPDLVNPSQDFATPRVKNMSFGETLKPSVTSEVLFLARPIAKKFGLDIWDVIIAEENGECYLRILVDKPEGVSIEDCEALSRAIEDPLDELDPIKKNYYLEVCSPGLERELKKKEHFTQSLGSQVKVTLLEADKEGNTEIKGILMSISGDKLNLKKGRKFLEIDNKDILCVKLDDFNL
jgi:ribosome maturation factor RimP